MTLTSKEYFCISCEFSSEGLTYSIIYHSNLLRGFDSYMLIFWKIFDYKNFFMMAEE